jgi:cell shape-determining protein MreC
VRLEDLIQFQKPKFELQRLDRRSQEELDRLMDKNNEGKLTEKERARFKTLLDEVQKVTLYNSKMLVSQKRLRDSRHREVVAAR